MARSAVLAAALAWLSLETCEAFTATPMSMVLRRSAGSAPSTGLRDCKKFEVADVSYKLTFLDGSPVEAPEPLFDEGRVQFLVDQGNYFPGLHDAARTVPPGSQSTIVVPADKAFGASIPELMAQAPISAAPEDVKLGDKLQLSSGQLVRVTNIEDGMISLDANAPHAGKEVMLFVTLNSREKYEKSTVDFIDVAGGCFWGLELAFQRLPGVVGTAVGYTQGASANPTYESVCSGTTGHVEAVRVFYDRMQVVPETILEVLFDRHDATQLNRQGNDVGTQYRSGIYYHDSEQEAAADVVLKQRRQETVGKIVTEVLPAADFWYAEDYHQQYLQKGGQTAKKEAKEIIRCYG